MLGNKRLFAMLPALFAVFASGALHAQDQAGFCGLRDRTYMAYPVKTAPVIDGKLEKEFWSKLPRAKYFTINDYKNSSATRQTVFQIGYDETHLYLGAIMFEPFPDCIKDGKDVPENERDRISFIFSKTYDRNGNPAGA